MRNRQRLIRLIRIYPVIAITVLVAAYLLGGFTDRVDPLIPQEVVITALYLFVGAVPLVFIIAFLIIGRVGDKAALKNNNHTDKLNYQSGFDLPVEQMHGYKLALITGRTPTLTGLTGDTYLSDSSAKCSINQSMCHQLRSVSAASMHTVILMRQDLRAQLIQVLFY